MTILIGAALVWLAGASVVTFALGRAMTDDHPFEVEARLSTAEPLAPGK